MIAGTGIPVSGSTIVSAAVLAETGSVAPAISLFLRQCRRLFEDADYADNNVRTIRERQCVNLIERPLRIQR
ncbi:MAG TPA: hypothetical protein VJ770_09990 [Stellaceae bacterium]|nr:hypothetical protein [Stellaceae bacterium]